MDAPSTMPSSIGRYRVVRTLGGGAMGVVYEAHDAAIDRKVAIKLVRTDLLEGKERKDYVERFRQEAQAVGRCNHPGIVAIFDYAIHKQNPFLVMEYVDGVGLDQALSQGKHFAPSAAIHVILAVLDALSCAHAVGIVHRDIKPGNILLMTGGGVKVADFGVARLDSSNLTLGGMVIGTPRYMSPEQCYGGAIDQRSDLFSTAVVFQEMLIGARPFTGRNLTEIAYHLIRDPPLGGGEVEAVAGSAVHSVIQRALSKAPGDRYASADVMADALREALGQPVGRSSPAETIDETIVAVRAGGASPEPLGGNALDPVLLTNIERRLASHLGPIARYLVQTSLPTARSVDDLCDRLAQQIDSPEDRERFRSEALEVVRSGTTARPAAVTGPSQSAPLIGAQISQDEIERARSALAETLGPIAKILVQRALGQAQSSQQLWDLLASHIDPADARADFVARRYKA